MSPYIPRDPVRRNDRILARGVFFILLALFSLTFNGMPEEPRGEADFQVTRALATGSGWALRDLPRAGSDGEATSGLDAEFQEGAGEWAGRWFARGGQGHALLGVPFYWIGRCVGSWAPGLEKRHHEQGYYGVTSDDYFAHLALAWRGPLLTALTALLLVLAARRLRVERSHAWFAAFAYGLSTFAWAQSRTGPDDVQATFLLFLSFHLLLRIRARLTRLEYPSAGDLAALGLAIALTLLTRLDTLPAVLVLCAATEVILTRGYGVLRDAPWGPERDGGLPGRAAAVVVVLPVLLGTAFLLWVEHAKSGSWTLPRPEKLASPAQWPAALSGLLISPGMGLVWMAPMVLLVPFGIARTRRRGERLLERVLVGVFVGTLLSAVVTQAWHGGWSYGPRLLLPALPFLWLAVALGLRSAQSLPVGRALVLGLLMVGVLIQLPGVLVSAPTHLDLAHQAAPGKWPDGEWEHMSAGDGGSLPHLHWEAGFAAPWAHWRILRHRSAGLGEEFDAGVLYGVERRTPLRPSSPALEGFRHLAWVDLRRRLGGTPWAILVALGGMVVLGIHLTSRGLVDRGR
jgi:hypothetical protein